MEILIELLFWIIWEFLSYFIFGLVFKGTGAIILFVIRLVNDDAPWLRDAKAKPILGLIFWGIVGGAFYIKSFFS